MKYIIGVDSGGTSTTAVAYDISGNPLFNAEGGFGNLLNNQEQALSHLRSTVDTVLNQLGEKNCQAIVFGIAGVDAGGFKETVEEAFQNYPGEIVILNDAWLAHYALLQGKDGCLVISGTGSIALGKAFGQEGRVGGWGNILGDEGSGYAIAKQLIQDALYAYDAGRSLSALEEALYQELQIDSPLTLAKFVYQSSKDQISKLSLLISEYADKGDQQASRILETAGEALGEQTLLLLNKLEITENPIVAVTGSVLTKNEIVFETFKKTILALHPTCEFIRKDVSNTLGGFYFARRQNSF